MTLQFVTNAAGRRVPTVVNDREQTPYQGARVHRPAGGKQAPPIRSLKDSSQALPVQKQM